MDCIAGSFGSNRQIVIKRTFGGSICDLYVVTGLISTERIRIEQIESIEVATQENSATIARSLGLAVAGSVIAGGIGAIVGAIAGSGSKTRLFLLVSVQGRGQLLIAATPQEHKELIAARMRPIDRRRRARSTILSILSFAVCLAALIGVFIFLASID